MTNNALEPVYISRECVKRVLRFKFLCVHMDADLQWSSNTLEVMKKAQQHLTYWGASGGLP